MTITDYSVKLQDIQTTYRAMFDTLFLSTAQGTSTYGEFTEEVSCEGSAFEYAFMSAHPTMREHVGLKNLQPLRANSYRIPVAPFEKTTSISKVQYLGDPLGIITGALAKWLGSVKRDLDKLVTDKLLTGFSEAGYDGVAFFSTSHPNGPSGGVQSNTGTSALDATSFKAARAAMASLRDENGEPLNLDPNILMVGPKLRDAANTIVNADIRPVALDVSGKEANASVVTAAGASNVLNSPLPYGQGLHVLVNPRLTGTYENYWFLIDSSNKPMICATLEAPHAVDNLADYRALPEIVLGVEASMAIGFGSWANIYGAAVTAG